MCCLGKFTGEVPDIIPLLELRIDENKMLIDEPKAIVELVLVRWKHLNGSNFTWEIESDMMSRYPHLFADA